MQDTRDMVWLPSLCIHSNVQCFIEIQILPFKRELKNCNLTGVGVGAHAPSLHSPVIAIGLAEGFHHPTQPTEEEKPQYLCA